ncbi:hypothetical protein MtrunA17_Chr3g0111951 [Medicago truncatula]|uniref:Uncharacterized protein n=1 Tax=Medicago truncatula TaxID=3880 RepID=A0A396IRE2_MEDTR|nr:hypothetical protein MtrunA17_Chr3g0111951 [Medicago truncatula]
MKLTVGKEFGVRILHEIESKCTSFFVFFFSCSTTQASPFLHLSGHPFS